MVDIIPFIVFISTVVTLTLSLSMAMYFKPDKTSVLLSVVVSKQGLREDLINLHYNQISQFSFANVITDTFTVDLINNYLQTEWLTFQDNRFLYCDNENHFCVTRT